MLRTSARVRRWLPAVMVMAALPVLLASGRARAQARVPAYDAAAVPDNTPPVRPLGISVSLGTRSDLIRSGGLDPFSTTDRVGQIALGVGYRFGDPDAAGLALAFEWNHGGSSALARSAATDLTMDRLSVGLEARYPLVRRLSVFGRLAPGLMRDRVTVMDSSAPAPAYTGGVGRGLSQTTWAPAVDVGGGLSFRFADVRGRGTPTFSFWLIADGGFGFTPAHDLSLQPSSEAQPGRTDEPVRFGELALRGGFARGRLAVSF